MTAPKNTSNMTDFLTMKEVQERLRVGRMAINHLQNNDEDFVTIKLGHRRLMRLEAFERFVEAKERQGRPHKQ